MIAALVSTTVQDAVALANAVLINIGVGAADAPVCWIDEAGAVRINRLMQRPAVDLDAAYALFVNNIPMAHGSAGRVGQAAANCWTVAQMVVTEKVWAPASGVDLANEVLSLARRLATIAEQTAGLLRVSSDSDR